MTKHELPLRPDNEETVRRGKVTFVDLAGSENLKQSGSTGTSAVTETGNINRSLFTLGSVISTLADICMGKKNPDYVVPFRDSQLTKLLMDSLGGHGVAMLIACCSPSGKCTDETLRTLAYAARASKIKNRPVAEVGADPKTKLIQRLQQQVADLTAENRRLRQAMAEMQINAQYNSRREQQEQDSYNAAMHAQQQAQQVDALAQQQLQQEQQQQQGDRDGMGNFYAPHLDFVDVSRHTLQPRRRRSQTADSASTAHTPGHEHRLYSTVRPLEDGYRLRVGGGFGGGREQGYSNKEPPRVRAANSLVSNCCTCELKVPSCCLAQENSSPLSAWIRTVTYRTPTGAHTQRTRPRPPSCGAGGTPRPKTSMCRRWRCAYPGEGRTARCPSDPTEQIELLNNAQNTDSFNLFWAG